MQSLIFLLTTLEDLIKLNCSVCHLEPHTQVHEVVDNDGIDELIAARALLGEPVSSLTQVR